jgi:hypothetical protein
MRLATHCHENGPPAGLRWIAACPKDCLDSIEIARKRSLDEALARCNAHQEEQLKWRGVIAAGGELLRDPFGPVNGHSADTVFRTVEW